MKTTKASLQRRIRALRQEANEYRDKVRAALNFRSVMWSYPRSRLNEAWNLKDLWDRTAAAQTLGFVVRLEASDTHGLVVVYEKPVPTTYSI